MIKKILVFLLLVSFLPLWGQKIVFGTTQDFEDPINATWHSFVYSNLLLKSTVSYGLWILENQQSYSTGTVLPTFYQGSRGYEPIASNTESTKFYSGGFIYLAGSGRGGLNISTRYADQKNASYSRTIDSNGKASLNFTDSNYKTIVINTVQMSDFQVGKLYMLTLTFDTKNVSFYIGDQLIGSEKYRAGNFEIAQVWLDKEVVVALTNFQIQAFTSGSKKYLISSIEQTTEVANENYTLLKNNGGLAASIPIRPTSRVDYPEYSMQFFTSMVKDQKIDIAMMSNDLKQQMSHITPLNAIADPYRMTVMVNAEKSNAETIIQNNINAWTEAQIESGEEKTSEKLAQSKNTLTIAYDTLSIAGQDAFAVYTMRMIGGLGQGYSAILVAPTNDKEVNAVWSIDCTGDDMSGNNSGNLFSPGQFAELNVLMKNIFSTFVYKK